MAADCTKRLQWKHSQRRGKPALSSLSLGANVTLLPFRLLVYLRGEKPTAIQLYLQTQKQTEAVAEMYLTQELEPVPILCAQFCDKQRESKGQDNLVSQV